MRCVAFPLLGAWPSAVHVVDRGRSRTRTDTWLVRHAEPRGGTGQVEEVDGIRAVGVARGVFDVIRARELREAVVVLDHALHSHAVDVADLHVLLESAAGLRGCRRARAALDLADARAESPGESISRVAMIEARLTPPVLQHAFAREQGGADRVDFWWPRFGVIGEFDGEAKYLDASLRGGLSAEQVVLNEKYREDRLRAQPGVRRFVRWNWREALQRGPMLQRLAQAGVR